MGVHFRLKANEHVKSCFGGFFGGESKWAVNPYCLRTWYWLLVHSSNCFSSWTSLVCIHFVCGPPAVCSMGLITDPGLQDVPILPGAWVISRLHLEQPAVLLGSRSLQSFFSPSSVGSTAICLAFIKELILELGHNVGFRIDKITVIRSPPENFVSLRALIERRKWTSWERSELFLKRWGSQSLKCPVLLYPPDTLPDCIPL